MSAAIIGRADNAAARQARDDQRRLLGWLSEQYEPATVEQIASGTGLSPAQVRRFLPVLREGGKVVDVGPLGPQNAPHGWVAS